MLLYSVGILIVKTLKSPKKQIKKSLSRKENSWNLSRMELLSPPTVPHTGLMGISHKLKILSGKVSGI